MKSNKKSKPEKLRFENTIKLNSIYEEELFLATHFPEYIINTLSLIPYDNRLFNVYLLENKSREYIEVIFEIPRMSEKNNLRS